MLAYFLGTAFNHVSHSLKGHSHSHSHVCHSYHVMLILWDIICNADALLSPTLCIKLLQAVFRYLAPQGQCAAPIGMKCDLGKYTGYGTAKTENYTEFWNINAITDGWGVNRYSAVIYIIQFQGELCCCNLAMKMLIPGGEDWGLERSPQHDCPFVWGHDGHVHEI